MGPARRHLSLAPAVLALALLCAGTAPVAHAQADRKAPAAPPASLLSRDPAWESLTPAQRTALAPLQKEWSSIDADRKEKWLEIADRFPRMSPDERARIQTRMTQWARLSPKERGEARLHYQELRQLTPAERQARWEQYRALPPEQRARLAERAAPGREISATAPAAPGSGVQQKSNLVTLPPAPAGGARPVAPTVVQARPGATTTLISKPPAPPAHQQPGLPKVAATPGFVDSTTLLPRRGAQAAGVRSAASGAAPPAASR